METWDVYSEDRIRTGRIIERGSNYTLQKGEYRLVVHICIFTADGRMLIQKRQPFKHGWSGMWDVSVGGSVLSGETSRAAALRETAEEIGLNIAPHELRRTLTLYTDNDGVIDDWYAAVWDITEDKLSSLVLQKSEVEQVALADKDKILQMMREGLFIPRKESFIDLIFYLDGQNRVFTAPDKSVQAKGDDLV